LLLLDASLVVDILVESGDDGRVEDVMVLACVLACVLV
jgi:hypothetical protein